MAVSEQYPLSRALPPKSEHKTGFAVISAFETASIWKRQAEAGVHIGS